MGKIEIVKIMLMVFPEYMLIKRDSLCMWSCMNLSKLLKYRISQMTFWKKKKIFFFKTQNYDDRVFQIKLIIWLIAYTTYTCTMFYLNLGFQTQYACKCIQRLSAHVQYLFITITLQQY